VIRRQIENLETSLDIHSIQTIAEPNKNPYLSKNSQNNESIIQKINTLRQTLEQEIDTQIKISQQKK
jgi:hypothetical protein